MKTGAISRWNRALVALLSLLLACLYMLTTARPVYAQQIVEVSYWGQNNVHIRYDYSSACDDCQRELVAEIGESTTVLRTFGAGKIEGEYHHDGLAPGQYTYRIIEFRMEAGERVEVNKTPGRQAQITGRDVGGTLLFDESLGGEVFCTGITVPDGTALAVNAVVSSRGTNCTIGVHGRLSLSSSTQTERAVFAIYRQQGFSGIGKVRIDFRAGSGGSTVSHSRNITADIRAGGITFDNVQSSAVMGYGANNFGIVGGEDIQLAGRFENVEILGVDGLTVGGFFPVGIEGTWNIRNSKGVTSLKAGIDGKGSLSVVDCEWGAAGPQLDLSDLSVTGAGSAEFVDNSFVGAIAIWVAPESKVTIKNSRFLDRVYLTGAVQNLSFEGNHFGDVVELRHRSAVRFTDNVFRREIGIVFAWPQEDSWCEDNGLRPIIEENSFVGPVAFRNMVATSNCESKDIKPVVVGRNYYGDPGGPTRDDYIRWLDRGARFAAEVFRLATRPDDPGYLTTGAPWQDTDVFPDFWLNGSRLGQHTFTGGVPNLLRGKESLFVVDMVTSHERVQGARVWVNWNGVEVWPTVGRSPTLRRDFGPVPAVHTSARSTLNFILPAVNAESTTLTLWLDTTGLTGYADSAQKGEVKKLLEMTVHFKEPPGPVGIVVVPVGVGSSSPSVGDVIGVVDTLRSATPAMFPVTGENLYISRDVYGIYVSHSRWTTVLANRIARQLVAYREAQRYHPVNNPRGRMMDIVVGVLPAGTLGGADGAYLNLHRNVVLVDEKKPEAVFHEMGHAIGLYNWMEQYNIPGWRPSGRPLEGVTLFMNVNGTSNPTINNTLLDYQTGRIRHVAAPGQWWHDPVAYVVDVMGASDPFWPHPNTFLSFEAFFYKAASEPRSPTLPVRSAAAEQGNAQSDGVIVTADIERIEVTEQGWYVGVRRCVTYRPRMDTVRVFPLEEWAGSLHSPPEEWQPVSLDLCLSEGPYSDGAGDVQFCFHPKDADGVSMMEYYQCRRVLPAGDIDTARQEDVAVFFFAVPESAAAYSMFAAGGPEIPVATAEVWGGTDLQVNLRSPAPGATLGDTVTLEWDSHMTPIDPARPSVQPMLHQVYYSIDGATWVPMGMPTAGTSMVLNTELMPAGVEIAFRVVASDGLHRTQDQVGGLQLPPQPPQPLILMPRDGDRAEPSHSWTLRAWAVDDETGAPLTGEWRSSRDGVLGQGASLANVVLSQGAHQLRYTVTDGRGVSGWTEIAVVVEPMPTVDLALQADALRLIMPWRDPVIAEDMQLALGIPQTATLHLRNTGIPVTATLQLFVHPPSGSESLLAEKTLALEPFQTDSIDGVLTAVQSGVYRLRGRVLAHSPSDRNPANNEYVWEIPAHMPGSLALSASTLHFSSPMDMQAQRILRLENTGEQGLTIQQVALTHEPEDAQGFVLWSDQCTGMGLSPEQTCAVTIRFTPTEDAMRHARIEIVSTDPIHPLHSVALAGQVGELQEPDDEADTAAYLYLPQITR